MAFWVARQSVEGVATPSGVIGFMSVLELGQQQVALGVGVHALHKGSESGGGVDTGVSVRHGVPFRLGVRARLGASGSVRSV
jgi:hypothetical protein